MTWLGQLLREGLGAPRRSLCGTGQPSLAVGPRHQHNGDTCDRAKGPIGRFRASAKAPSTSGVQTNLGLLSAVMRHPSLVSYRARARRRPTFLVSVARPRAPLLCDGPHCPATGLANGRHVSRVVSHLLPGFAVTTRIESAPMKDVRETSVEIGAVAGRPAQHPGALHGASSTGAPTRYTSPTRSAVPWRRFELTVRSRPCPARRSST